ncbi:MAG: cytochrome c3 family protein, partial [Marinicella sp.]
MNYLVRKPVIGSSEEFQDLDFNVPALTIGSASEHAVNLADLPPGCLSIKAKNASTAGFRCTGDLTLQHNRKPLKKGKLVVGEVYQLEIYDLEIIDLPVGFDFALSIKKSNRVKHVANYSIESRKKAPIRTLAYLSFICIILFFLVLPLLRSMHPNIEQVMESTPLPSDHSWISGPVAMAHNIPEISNQCTTCHQQPFVKVADQQCLNCHKNMGDHIESSVALNEKVFHGFMCQSCHKEHNEPARITRNDDALCIDCHAQIDQYETGQENLVKNVHGFTADSHPEFRLSLLQADGDGAAFGWRKTRPAFDPNVQLKEQSNLKFSHAVHLDPEKVQDQINSQALNCDSCHQLQEDGRQFNPITMDKDCRNCHQLTFDVFNPDIELPHGNLRAANVALQAHYI